MRVSVVGIANVETAVPVGAFPVPYEPVRHLPGRIRTRTGGVGLNVARALTALGARVALTAPLAPDLAGTAVRAEAAAIGLELRSAATTPAATPRSVLLVDDQGRRQVHTDLGDALAVTVHDDALLVDGRPADVAVLANLDLSRPLLAAARSRGTRTVVDLQDVQGFDDPYDQDFLAGADVLCLSGERLTGSPEQLLAGLLTRTAAELVVLGLGAQGCLAWQRGAGAPVRTAAAGIPPGTETTGAGDLLLAGVVTWALDGRRPLPEAVQLASLSAAEGLTRRADGRALPSRPEVEALWQRRSGTS